MCPIFLIRIQESKEIMIKNKLQNQRRDISPEPTVDAEGIDFTRDFGILSVQVVWLGDIGDNTQKNVAEIGSYPPILFFPTFKAFAL